MTVTFFKGRPRSGKGVHMTMNGCHDYLHGRRIYANYWLRFPHIRLSSPDDVLTLATMEMDIAPKTVLLQEADKWFDARYSMSRENKMLSSFTGQSGKREIDILYDSQFPTRIDKALRDITESEIYCECVRDEKKNPIYFDYTYFDLFGGTERNYKIPAFFMEQFYGMYNTREATKSLIQQKEDRGEIKPRHAS